MGTDSIIYIRADGNSDIATGHLVRCLCIAEALEKQGKKVCFLVSDSTSTALLTQLSSTIFHQVSFSFETVILETAVYNNLDLEIPELYNFLSNKQENPSHKLSLSHSPGKPVLLIDSYFVTPNYLKALKAVALLSYLDDLRTFDYEVDLVINYDVIPPSKMGEYKQSYKKSKAVLLGAEYTPLRRQFQNQSFTLREKIQDLLITTGGSDPYHLTEKLSSFLLENGLELNLHIVVGGLFHNLSALDALSHKHPQISLHREIKDMAALMKQCDYAVSAAGTTLYELCALGIPTVSFSMADNQIPMAETFAETKAIPYAGDLRTSLSSVFQNILHHLTLARENRELYEEQHFQMGRITRGNGAKLIAAKLSELSDLS